MEEIPILFEDTDFLVVNKPSGLVVHSDGKTEERNLADWVLERYPENKEVGEPLVLSTGEVIFRPGIVHRIDRETSGALLVAKNQAAYLHAKNQFKNRSIKKTYNAFVYGKIKEDSGVVNLPIARSKNDFRKWTAERGKRGEEREAVTKFFVEKRGKEETFLELRPLTGRTHQIRVHMKAIGHPVVCDMLYAPQKPPVLQFSRLALHAKALEFQSIEGKNLTIEAPLPKDFETALKLLE